MTHQFLKTDHDYLFWIDADIRFRAEDALRMLEADVDIIGGIYPKKEINWQQVRQAAVEGKENLQNYTGSFVVNLPPGQTSLTVRQDQPCEVMYVGTGFMLIKRHVFEKLKKHRNLLAQSEGVPAYLIFSNQTLEFLTRLKPRTLADGMKIRGVGEKKAGAYLADFIRLIQKHG